MSQTKVQSVKYEMAMNSMKQLYDLAGRLNMKTPSSTSDKQQFLVRYKDIERYRQQMEDAMSVLFSNIETVPECKQKEWETNFAAFNDMYYSIKVLHDSLIEPSTGPERPSKSSFTTEFHLPKISLPRFSGSYTDWPNFISMFNSLIHNNQSLSNVEKMHYLLSVLDKEPLSLVKNLKLSNTNYSVAYQLLTERYENKRVIADKHIEAILNVQNLSQVNFRTLNKFVNTYKENLSALKALDFDVTSWSFLLLHIILKKLSLDLRTKFESEIDPITIPTFDQLSNFLEKQLRVLENISVTSSSCKSSSSNTLNVTHPISDSNHTNKFNFSCPCCNQNHNLYQCPKFDAMAPEQRKTLVMKQKLCFNCLRSHHISKCSSSSVCQVCRGRHHTKLHISSVTQVDSIAAANNESAVPATSSTVQIQSLYGVDSSSTMVLGTAIVEVQDANGFFHRARALIDCGSQVSIMTEALAQRLRLPRTQAGSIFGLGASSAQQSRGVVSCNIRSVTDNNQILNSKLLILKRITNNLPSVSVHQAVVNNCSNLILADKNFMSPGQIDLLFGIDLYDQILDGRKFSLGDGMPTAYFSIFGWIIMGKAPAASAHTNNVTTMACTVDLNLALTRFWEAEQPPSQPLSDPEDILCEKHFCDTHVRDTTGRFIVRLPFKVNHKPLGDTYMMALKRFYNLERRLLKDVQLRELYVAFMRDYLDVGHMREVTDHDRSDRYYIPHHGVLREHSSTTKLRAVFDASALSSTGVSLNQVLMSGPKLQKNIEDIIMRFRVHKIVFTCDIKQMYRQVRLDDSDCKYQTILWRESPDQPLKQYELNTVTYGVSSSAFQAIRVVHELAHLNSEQHPDASKVLLEDTFVDDVVSGSNSLDSAKDLQQGLVNILSQGGFILRKWSSNSKEFLDMFSNDHCEQPYRFEMEGDGIYKVLGIEWNAQSDCFVYRVSKMNHTMTMRGVLSNIARLYDPCGFLAPVTFFAKHIMQRLWSQQCGWDDPLPTDVLKVWSIFLSNFDELDKVLIPRWIVTDQPLSCQVHGFSDASERGYAACVYLRVHDADDSVSVQLLIAKSRVAPLKQKVTVPKLELSGALLLAHLLEHVKSVLQHKVKFDSTIAWCDSNIVLSWIKTSPHVLQTYEGNRVSQIQALTPDVTWRHVPSEFNAADSASRGLFPSQLVTNSLWWSPSWLKEEPAAWPGDTAPLKEEELPGLKSSVVSSNVAAVSDDLSLLKRYSSFPKLQAVVAWCKRFLYNLRNSSKRRTGNLSVFELSSSLRTIIKLVQTEEFAQTVGSLRENKNLKSSLIRLNPFLDSEGLLRVGGRLSKSELDYDAKHPILLPKAHYVTKLIIDDYHRMFLHPGVNTMQVLLQRKFWILSARRAIRRQIFQCLRCYRLRPISLEPFMADLPVHRVTSCLPFQKVGVDFAGPFLQKSSRVRNARSFKSYLCIFICFTTKCVHLELVSELSTEAFLACLDRFVSRRGLPSDIFSDCGTNFVGARNHLKDVYQFHANSNNEIQKSLACKQIVWHLNPPASPHMGGLWESAVRSAKSILARVIGDRPLLFEELATIFSKVEAALNSRPLCPLSNDPNDLQVLTPGHFLIGKPLLAVPEENLEEDNLPVLKRWQLLRQITQHFWRRWQAEYLHTLQQRPKWLTKGTNLKEGDLVLIKDSSLPPLQWRKARVIRVCPGSDGIVRVVEVKTSTGNLLRPVVKLCPLLPNFQ